MRGHDRLCEVGARRELDGGRGRLGGDGLKRSCDDRECDAFCLSESVENVKRSEGVERSEIVSALSILRRLGTETLTGNRYRGEYQIGLLHMVRAIRDRNDDIQILD